MDIYYCYSERINKTLKNKTGLLKTGKSDFRLGKYGECLYPPTFYNDLVFSYMFIFPP